ncbi:MAG: hypothetical protein DWQ15_07950 [Proteobacteria bacterium]|nr:MAG: hypothetical protein DWQ15_07950 [Pseudomonadota bacterium]
MGLTLAACGGGDVPNSAYVPAQEQQLRDAELAGLPASIEVLDTLPTEIVLEVEEEVVATTAPLPVPNNPESDAERLERNRALYTLIEPTEVPTRPGTDIPNIVAYAIKTSNPVGEPLYSRSPFKSENRSLRNCAKYVSDAAAQEAFLKAGGPERDRYGLDPDGDGFACRWDPTPFRAAIKK